MSTKEDKSEIKEVKTAPILGRDVLFQNTEKGSFKVAIKGSEEYDKISKNKAFKLVKEL